MEKYNVLELIGEGSFGRVFRGVRKSDLLPVALKLIPKMPHTSSELSSLRSECKIQLQLSHPNVVKMLDAFETPKEIVAVTEFVPDGDLNKLLVRKDKSSNMTKVHETKVKQLAGDLMGALHYLHSRRVLHRDLKPANILLDETSNVAKICDFGFARHLGVETMVLTSIKGTPLYMAPELIEERPYDHTADLWSAGAILYELSVGFPPFPTNSLFQLIKKIRYEQVTWPNHLSEDLKSFLQGLLEKDCKKRSTWQQIMEHPILQKTSFHRNIQQNCGNGVFSDNECSSGTNPLSPPLSRLFSPQPLTEKLSESQELAKEIQRQDKAKLLPGGSQTLIKVAEKYEEQKRKMKEEQLKLLNYQIRQNQSHQQQPQMGSKCNEFYRQRRNAIFPGLEHYDNKARRNSEMISTKQMSFSPSSQHHLGQKETFQRRPSNLAEYCQNTSTVHYNISCDNARLKFETQRREASCGDNTNNIPIVSPQIETLESSMSTLQINDESEVTKENNVQKQATGKQFEFSLHDLNKENSNLKRFECEEWSRYLDTEMKEIISYDKRKSENGSIDFLLNQSYLNMICSPLKNKSTMIDNPFIVEKVSILLSLPFVASMHVTDLHSPISLNEEKKKRQKGATVLNCYVSIKILNLLLYALKHCCESMLSHFTKEIKPTEDSKTTQNLKAISSIQQICIRLFYFEYGDDELSKELIKQFCNASQTLNLSKTIRHLLLFEHLEPSTEEEGGQTLFDDVKLETIQLLTRILSLSYLYSSQSKDDICHNQAVNLLISIFEFTEQNGIQTILKILHKEESKSNSSKPKPALSRLIHIVALWSKLDEKFRKAIYKCSETKSYVNKILQTATCK